RAWRGCRSAAARNSSANARRSGRSSCAISSRRVTSRSFPEGGGMLIRNSGGEVISAVGVTGDTEDRDEELAVHESPAAGLKTDADCAGMGRRVGLPPKSG